MKAGTSVATYQTADCGQAPRLVRGDHHSVLDYGLTRKHGLDVFEWIAFEDDELRLAPCFDDLVVRT